MKVGGNFLTFGSIGWNEKEKKMRKNKKEKGEESREGRKRRKNRKNMGDKGKRGKKEKEKIFHCSDGQSSTVQELKSVHAKRAMRGNQNQRVSSNSKR